MVLPSKWNVFQLEVFENTEDLKSNLIFRATFPTDPPNQLLKKCLDQNSSQLRCQK